MENKTNNILEELNKAYKVFIENKNTVPGWSTTISIRNGLEKMINDTRDEWGI